MFRSMCYMLRMSDRPHVLTAAAGWSVLSSLDSWMIKDERRSRKGPFGPLPCRVATL